MTRTYKPLQIAMGELAGVDQQREMQLAVDVRACVHASVAKFGCEVGREY